MRVWDSFLAEQDKAHLATSRGKRRYGFGARAALLSIDNYRRAVGDAPQPLLESVKLWPSSTGLAGWTALGHIETLFEVARAGGIPVIHVTGLAPEDSAPLPGEVVLRKTAPSAFFGTPLMAHLNAIGVDTLIVCGESTSGCVRASVVDARSYRFQVIVVEECVYDRHEACYAINLFDMDQKYADVLPLDDVTRWIKSQAASNHEASQREDA